MERITPPGFLVLVGSSDGSGLSRALEAELSLDVRSVSAAAVLEAGDDPAATDGTPNSILAGTTSDPLRGVVLTVDTAGTIRSLLSILEARLPGVPVVVAPSDGSERAATAALRSGATDYVPVEDPQRAAGRIREVVTSPSESTVRRPMAYHRLLAADLPDEAFVIDETGTYVEVNVRPDSAPLYTSPTEDLVGSRIRDVFPEETATDLHACLDRAIETDETQAIEYPVETTRGRRRFEGRLVPIDERIDGRRAVVCLARDITERAERERELQLRQDELETLNRINRVIRQVIETLVEAPTQSAIEQKVCERLVDSELYCGSWIAERTGAGELTYRTGAGEAETFLSALEECAVADGPTAHRAVAEGTVQTVENVAESEATPEPLRAAASADGVETGIAVPVSHEDTIYGVLCVLAGRSDAFSEGERNAFRLLGETIGFAINAVKNRQLLFSDSVLELEFRIDDGETFSFHLSREYGCTCSLEWAGSTADGRLFQYVTVEGVDGEAVLEAAETHESVEECRLIRDGRERCTVEVRLRKSGVRMLANHGATIRDAWVDDDGVGGLVVEVPRDADVREIAEALQLVYDSSELEARREVDRPVRTAVERRNRVLDQLTDRQLTTLRLAYYGGFFDWPRESTGEEVAEAMDVSAPTMHQHLRKGLKTVLGEFFEESNGAI